METFLERSRNTSRVGSPSADAAAGVDVFAEGFHLTKQRGQLICPRCQLLGSGSQPPPCLPAQL